MKVRAINLSSSPKAQKTNTKKLSKSTNYNQTNVIQKNSMSEALGRSQVSFKGTTKIDNGKFIFIQKDLLGRLAEDLVYATNSGDLRYRAFDSKEEITKEIAFNRQKGEYVIKTTDDEYQTETRQTPTMTYTKTLDSQLRPVYFKRENRAGKSETLEIDYDRGRMIRRLKEAGSEKEEVQVFDRKRQPVTSGPLVEDRIEGEDGIIRTINIITGAIYRIEKYNGRDSHIIDYSKTTGLKTKETRTIKGRKFITLYNESGIKSKKITIERNGDRMFDFFAPDGNDVISTFKNSYFEDGKLKERTVYEPGTETIKEITQYNPDENSYTKYNYISYPNVTVSSEYYQNDVMQSCSEYYETGKDNRILKKKISFVNKRETLEEHFSATGKKRKVLALHKKDDKVICVEKFDEDTGVLYEKREVHASYDNCFTIERYDNFEGTLMKRQIYRDGVLMVNQFFDERGIKIRKIQKFNPDRSFRIIEFDNQGKQVRTRDYNADKTPKKS